MHTVYYFIKTSKLSFLQQQKVRSFINLSYKIKPLNELNQNIGYPNLSRYTKQVDRQSGKR